MYIQYPTGGGGITTYATFAAFPATASNGTVALALDTDILYAYNTGSASWVQIGGPGVVLSVGTIDSQPKSANGAQIVASQLIMQTADATHPGLLSTGTQGIAGLKTFLSTLAIGSAGGNTGILNLLGTTSGVVSVKPQAVAGTYNFNLPTTAGTSGFLLTSAGGVASPMTWSDPTLLPTSLTIAAFGSTPNANGLTLTANALNMEPADATHPGGISTTTQSLLGQKTFLSGLISNRQVSIGGTADEVQLSIQGNSSQTQNIIEVLSSGFTGLLSFNNSGNLHVSGTIGASSTITGLAYFGPNAGSATSGIYNLGTSDIIAYRNAANNADLTLGLDGLDNLTFSGAGLKAPQLVSTISTGTAPLVVSSTTQVANLNAATAGSATTATTATNLAGGLGGSIPYQSAVNTTAMLANGTAGQILSSQGTTLAPIWINNTVGTVTSVGLSVPGTSLFGVTGSPVTTSGTLGLTTTGTSGGIPFFNSTSTLNTSALLAANQLMLGGGAGTAPLTLGSLGTTTTVLHGNAAGAPTFGAVSLTADVSGTLPIGNGGTGQTTKAAAFDALSPMTTGGDLIYGGASGTGTRLANGTAGQVLTSSGTTVAPTWSSIVAAGVNPTVQKFVSGSGNYTTPAGVSFIRVRMVASGGSGSGSATAGWVAANDGNDTTFGLHTAAKGLKGGAGNTGGTGGAGGSGTIGAGGIGSIVVGNGGGAGDAAISGVVTGGHGGGGGIFGGGATAQAGGNNGVAGIANTGGGGGGAALGSGAGGNGGGGGGALDIIIAPTAGQVFAYSVGASAAGGTAGSGGNTGGASGSGYIEVSEAYVNAATSTNVAIGANLFMAGPTSGAAATPTFRALVAADLPAPVSVIANNPTSSVTSGFTDVTTWTTVEDTNSAFVASTGVFTAPRAALYGFSISLQCIFSGSSANQNYQIKVLKNGSGAQTINTRLAASLTAAFATLTGTVRLAANDTVKFQIQTDPGSPSFAGGATNNFMSIFEIA